MFDQTGRFVQRDKVGRIYKCMLNNMSEKAERSLAEERKANKILETNLRLALSTNRDIEKKYSRCESRMQELNTQISEQDTRIEELQQSIKGRDAKKKRKRYYWITPEDEEFVKNVFS